ncbi:MAG: catalase-related domain-containing protein, partial [Gemmatimonadaceae bacterium]
TNYNQLPVNQPHAAKVTTYMHEGNMQYHYNESPARVYAPNSYGGPAADPALTGDSGWETDGELVRAAQTLRSDDDDFGQAGTLYRDVFSDESKDRFLKTLTGQYKALTVDRIKERFLWYWTQVDAGLGAKLRVEVAKPTESANEAAEPVGVGSDKRG